MKALPLEKRLLSVFRLAVAQRRWAVADHLLAAIEALDCGKDALDQTNVEAAYLELAAWASQPANQDIRTKA